MFLIVIFMAMILASFAALTMEEKKETTGSCYDKHDNKIIGVNCIYEENLQFTDIGKACVTVAFVITFLSILIPLE
jgi:hypothetical protein